MIYDCFSFFNELDLLEIRLNELDPVVDRFVFVEATLTHNGDKKPLYYAENKSRFAKFAEKIIHIVVTEDDFRSAESGKTFQERAWMRENVQRNAIVKGLVDANDDDVIIVSDLDEIPRAGVVRNVAENICDGEVVGLILNSYIFYANLRNVSDPFWGNDPKMAKIKTFKDDAAYTTSKYSHFVLKSINRGPTATRFRYIKPARRIPNAGWHFSYLGGASAVCAKIRAIVENEWARQITDDELREVVLSRITTGETLGNIVTGGGYDKLLREEVDGSYPKFLVENADKFSHLIIDGISDDGFKIKLLRIWYFFTARIRRFIFRILFYLTPKCVRTIIKKILGYNF